MTKWDGLYLASAAVGLTGVFEMDRHLKTGVVLWLAGLSGMIYSIVAGTND